jgi:hypothetical protein
MGDHGEVVLADPGEIEGRYQRVAAGVERREKFPVANQEILCNFV